MAGSRARVLCTEDHADTREMLRIMLGFAGFEVVCTDSAADALQRARAERFDLYLLDNRLPGISGVELCQKLRDFDLRTPILFYSPAAFEKERRSALDSGAQAYLAKPVDGDVLVAMVQELIAQGKKQ